MSPCSRRTSCSASRSEPTTFTDRTTAPTRMPMIAMTTSSSSSEKPRCAQRGAGELVEIPVTDVGIDAFAAFLAVGAIREDVELSMLTRIGVLVGVVPRVDRQLPKLRLPVRGGGFAGVRDERLQAVRSARIAEIVEPIQVERRLDAANVLFGPANGCLVDVADEVRHYD